MDIQQRIREIEKEIRETPYHKGTEHHIGILRARLAKLQDQLLERGGKKGGGGFAIKKTGDATVVLVGFPSVGKSTLLNRLTNAKSPVAPYEFTTVSVIPGMMKYHSAYIQILDVPGLLPGAAQGRGRGREVLSIIRGADLLLLLGELGRVDAFGKMEDVLYQAGVRINQELPKIRIEKRSRGGLVLHKGVKQTLSDATIKEVAQEFGIRNAELTLKEAFTPERLVDGFSQNRAFVEALYLVNKIDLQPKSENYHTLIYDNQKVHPISALKGTGIDQLKEEIWKKLELVRIYVAKPGEKPDYSFPVIVKQGSTLLNVAKRLGEEFAESASKAKISGAGASFQGQTVSLNYKVIDGMEVRFLRQ